MAYITSAILILQDILSMPQCVSIGSKIIGSIVSIISENFECNKKPLEHTRKVYDGPYHLYPLWWKSNASYIS